MTDSDDYTRLYRDHVLAKLCRAWPRFAGGFEAFDETRRPEYPALKAQAMAWADGFSTETTRGWYAAGRNGCGKTHLAYATAKRLIERGYYDVHIFEVVSLLQDVKDSWSEPGFSEGAFFRALVESDLVILDDLGSEKASDWSLGVLFSFINSLSRAKKPIIVTSNYSGKELLARPVWQSDGQRVVSRLAAMCEPLGPWPKIDQRIEEAKKA